MKELKFTVTTENMRDLDMIRERSGLGTYGQVVGNALRLYTYLTEQAADGAPAVKVSMTGNLDEPYSHSCTTDALIASYTRAREAERALLPSAPAPVAPDPTPAPARPWWQFWGRA